MSLLCVSMILLLKQGKECSPSLEEGSIEINGGAISLRSSVTWTERIVNTPSLGKDSGMCQHLASTAPEDALLLYHQVLIPTVGRAEWRNRHMAKGFCPSAS